MIYANYILLNKLRFEIKFECETQLSKTFKQSLLKYNQRSIKKGYYYI